LAENDAFIIYLYKLFGVSILTEPRADAAEIYTELQEKVPKLVQRIINKQQIIGALWGAPRIHGELLTTPISSIFWIYVRSPFPPLLPQMDFQSARH
jgi:hypothetical protein